MDPSTTEAHIRELESVRKQINLWRGGAVAVIFATTIICVVLLFSDVKALAQQGPSQERFVGRLQENLNQDLVPRLKEVAGSTMSEMQPIVQAEFLKLNQRVPEVTQASLKQIDELQVSLPKKSTDVLNETFNKAIKDQEPAIRKMFPDATEEQVTALFTNLGTVVTQKGGALAEEMLSPHLAAMTNIHANLEKIKGSDKNSANTTDDWQLALAVFDVVRDDVKDLTISDKKAAKMVSDAAKQVAGTANDIANKADKMSKEGNK